MKILRNLDELYEKMNGKPMNPEQRAFMEELIDKVFDDTEE